MANIALTSDAWTEISITSGTVQNISATADIELSAEQTDNSGVVLKPSELFQWDNETIYARAVTEDTGALRVVNFKRAAGGGGSYVLPVATASKLGGVKIGSNITIDGSGAISAPAAYTLPTAAANTLGGIKVGTNLSIDENGVLSATGGGGSVDDGTPIGRVVYDAILRDGYIRANGATNPSASTNYPLLLAFLSDNSSLLAADAAAYAANPLLFLYDENADELTVPNYVDLVPQGAASLGTIAAGLPNIKGKTVAGIYKPISGTFMEEGAYFISDPSTIHYESTANYSNGTLGIANLSFDASRSSSIYKDSATTVQPPAAGLIPQIRYE